MPIKLRILCIISAVCFLASTACLTGYAVEMMDRYSGEDDVPVEPVPDVSYTEPIPEPEPNPEPIPEPNPEPSYIEPEPVDPNPEPTSSYSESEYIPSDPGYTDSSEVINNPSQVTPGDLISEGNYPQAGTSSTYIDYTSQYIANTYSAVYDDNYVYIPSYTEPEQSMINTSSKHIDTDELTSDDWATIMLNLEEGNISDDGTKTFNFIKQNEEQGDTSISWMLYLGVGLILLSVFLIIFVIISTKKAASRVAFA